MFFSRFVSTGIGLLTTALVLLALLYFHRGDIAAINANVTALVISSVVVGSIVGLMLGMILSRWEIEQRRLCIYIENLKRTDLANRSLKPCKRLAPLTTAVDSSIGHLRRQIEQLTLQRRELEVLVRINESERRHIESIINALGDAVIVTNAFNEIALANDAAARHFEFDPKVARHQPIEHVVNHPALVEMIKSTNAAPHHAGHRTLELQLNSAAHPGQRHRTFHATLTSLSGEKLTDAGTGLNAGMVIVLRDVTLEKEIAEMKSEFVSNVSHEMRTPLSSIKAYMEMLVDGEVDDPQSRTEFYNIVQGEANRLTRLIENLLNISRIEAGVVKVQRELISMTQIVNDVLDVMQPQARSRNINLQGDLTASYTPIFADGDMIYQAVLNVISNAIKYTPEHGSVTVEVYMELEHERVVVRISDSGVGIPEKDLPRLFEKFYRVTNHKKMATGTGLGLNLVRQIIETVHGGKISVQSQVNQGSTFTLCLPIAENEIGVCLTRHLPEAV